MVTSRHWPNVILFHYFHPLYFHNRLTSSKLKYNLVSTCANSVEKHFIYARRLLNTRKLLILLFLSSFVQHNRFKLCFCCLGKRIFEITGYIFLLQTEQFFYLKNNKGKEGSKQNISVCGITFFPRVCTTKILIDWCIFILLSRESNRALCFGRIRNHLGVDHFPSFPVDVLTSSHVNLLLVQSHQAEIIIVKCLIHGCNNVTRMRVEFMIMRSESS